MLGELAGAPVPVERIGASSVGDVAPHRRRHDSKARASLGWRPRVDLRDGLRTELDWVRERREAADRTARADRRAGVMTAEPDSAGQDPSQGWSSSARATSACRWRCGRSTSATTSSASTSTTGRVKRLADGDSFVEDVPPADLAAALRTGRYRDHRRPR